LSALRSSFGSTWEGRKLKFLKLPGSSLHTTLKDEIAEAMQIYGTTEKQWFRLPIEERVTRLAFLRNKAMKEYLGAVSDKEASEIRIMSDWL
jgi:hypothetical protein